MTRLGRPPLDAHEIWRNFMAQHPDPTAIALYNQHRRGSDDPGGLHAFPASKGIRVA
jgi:hypothetical protein